MIVTIKNQFRKKTVMSEGSPCRHCGTKIVLKESKFKASKLLKPYYYNAYYRCPSCGRFYLSGKFKVYNK